MKKNSALFPKRLIVLGLGFIAVIVVLVFAFLLLHMDPKKQESLIYEMKGLSYIEYFYFGSSTKISEVTKAGGFGHGMPGGMGTYFGEADLALWQGANDIAPSLKLEPYCLLRIADSQVEARNSQYVDLTINHVKNGDDPNVSDYVDTVGFSYDQNTYLITSNGRIYEVADESFFIDLFAFLADKDVLPPKAN